MKRDTESAAAHGLRCAPRVRLETLDRNEIMRKDEDLTRNLPQKCPQCGKHDFTEIKPKDGVSVFLLCAFAFVLDLFTPGGKRLQSVEAYNTRRPGWICNNCGWEIRIQQIKS